MFCISPTDTPLFSAILEPIWTNCNIFHQLDLKYIVEDTELGFPLTRVESYIFNFM